MTFFGWKCGKFQFFVLFSNVKFHEFWQRQVAKVWLDVIYNPDCVLNTLIGKHHVVMRDVWTVLTANRLSIDWLIEPSSEKDKDNAGDLWPFDNCWEWQIQGQRQIHLENRLVTIDLNIVLTWWHDLTNIFTILIIFDNFDNFDDHWQFLTIFTMCDTFWQCWNFDSLDNWNNKDNYLFYHFDNFKRQSWKFWQLRTWIQTIFVTWQLRVTLDSIHNSCDVFKKNHIYFIPMKNTFNI